MGRTRPSPPTRGHIVSPCGEQMRTCVARATRIFAPRVCTIRHAVRRAYVERDSGPRGRWVDADPETCNVSLEDLERKLSPTTKARARANVTHAAGKEGLCSSIQGFVMGQNCMVTYPAAPAVVSTPPSWIVGR